LQQLKHITNADSLVSKQEVFKHLGNYHPLVSDTVADASKTNEVITQTFLQDLPVDFTIKSLQPDYTDWMVYVLLLLTFGFSLIWYYLPERAFSLFNFAKNRRDFRLRENVNTETPGIVILFFFILNYFITLSLFLFLSINKFSVNQSLIENKYLLFIIISVISFYLIRVIIILFAGYIFNTKDAANQQLKLYINIDNIIGIILIPVLFLLLFVRVDFIFYAGIILLFILHIFMWFQTFNLGKSISGFSILHLFMYLCTLEIIPVIVLIKLYSTELI